MQRWKRHRNKLESQLPLPNGHPHTASGLMEGSARTLFPHFWDMEVHWVTYFCQHANLTSSPYRRKSTFNTSSNPYNFIADRSHFLGQHSVHIFQYVWKYIFVLIYKTPLQSCYFNQKMWWVIVSHHNTLLQMNMVSLMIEWTKPIFSSQASTLKLNSLSSLSPWSSSFCWNIFLPTITWKRISMGVPVLWKSPTIS